MAGEGFTRRGSEYPGIAARDAARGATPRPAPLVDPALSPYADRSGDGWVLTESSAAVLALSAGRRRFLAGAAAARTRPIVVTGDDAVLTVALAEALQSLGGAWVTRSSAGYRDTRVGRRLDRPEDVFAPDFEPQSAPEHVRRPEAETVQFSVLASIRQRNRRTARYGGAVRLLADLLVDDAALDWGVAEPANLEWNDEQVAAYGRDALTHNPWLIVTGVGASCREVTGTLRLRATKQGAEEIVNLVADVGAEGSVDADDALADAADILGGLVAEGVPLIAIAFGRVGRPDLHRGSHFERPGAPLAILIGAPAVSRFELPLDELTERFGAVVVGPPRTPSIVVPLGTTIDASNYTRMRELLWALDPRALAAAIGDAFIDSLLGPDWRAEAHERAKLAALEAEAREAVEAAEAAEGAAAAEADLAADAGVGAGIDAGIAVTWSDAEERDPHAP